MSSNTITQNPIFAPTQISGCSLWYDVSDPAFLARSGSSITSLTSKGTSGTVISQSSSNPLYIANVYNSLPAMRFAFSGTLALSNATVASSVVQTNLNYVIFLVHNPNANNSTPFAFLTGGGSRLSVVTPEASNIQFDGISSRLSYSYPSQAAYLNGNLRMESFYSLNSTGYYRRDGSQLATGSLGSGSYNATQNLLIGGAHPNYNNYYYGGDICEVVWYNVGLTTSQIQLVEGYLAWKWGTTTYLPSNHPYKNRRVYSTSVLPLSIQPLVPISVAPSLSPFSFFNPTSVSTCSLWLDAADTSTITLTGGNLTRWNDKSGLNNYATNTGTVLYTRGLNGLNVATFSNATATNNVMVTQTFSIDAILETYFYLIQFGATIGSYGISLASSHPTQYSYYIYFIKGASTLSIDVGQISVGTIFSSSSFDNTTTGPINQTGLISFQRTGATTGEIRYNGTLLTTTNGGLSAGFYQPTGYRLGANLTTGSIGEHILYNSSISSIQRQNIEGYLAWKWGIQNNLPSNHPYKNAPPGLPVSSVPSRLQMSNKVFSPLSFSGCTLWLDGADPNGNGNVPSTGATISTWADKSSSGINFTGTNVTYTYDSAYRVNALTFNGTSSIFNQANTGLYPLNNVSTYSIFSVARRLSTNAYTAVYFAPGSANLLIYRFNNTNTSEWYLGPAADVYLNNTSTNGDGINELITQVSGTATGYINGNIIGSKTTATSSSQLNFVLGRQDGNPYLNGYIYEVIIYNRAVSTAQRQNIEGYLAWKYGLQGSLPSTHPFKNFPPPP
jgi:hypothetical protein